MNPYGGYPGYPPGHPPGHPPPARPPFPPQVPQGNIPMGVPPPGMMPPGVPPPMAPPPSSMMGGWNPPINLGGPKPPVLPLPAAPSPTPISTPIPTGPPPTAAIGGPNKILPQQLTTIYVGKIPPGVEDEFIKRVLEQCGKVSNWRRVADPVSGKKKGFGFCDYDSPEGVLRALRVLPSIKFESKELLLKVDDQTQNVLDNYVAQKKATIKEEKQKELQQEQQNGEKKKEPSTEDLDKEWEEKEKKEDQRIKLIILHLKNKREKGEDYRFVDVSELLKQPIDNLEKLEGDVTITEEVKPQKQELKNDKAEEQDLEKDKLEKEREREREQRRKEREERDYREREREWESREKAKEREREREREKENKDRENREERDLLYDDSERKRRSREYLRRKRQREREKEYDEIDRRKEMEEIEKKRREEAQKQEEERQKQLALEQQHIKEMEELQKAKELEEQKKHLKSVSPPPPPPPDNKQNETGILDRSKLSTLKFSTQAVEKKSLTAPIAPGFSDGTDEDSLYGKKKRRLVTLDKSLHKDSAQIKLEQIQQLINQIPTEKEDLFKFDLDWEIIDQCDIIEKKMKPWITKKIIEYLGEEEKSLIAFIVNKISKHTAPEELSKQLELVLEEDADQFLVRMWRMLIYEMLAAKENLC